MSDEKLKTTLFRNADVPPRFCNFSGAPDNFNKNGGVRSFLMFLEPDVAAEMAEGGWNIKQFNQREGADPDEIPPYNLPVTVSFRNRPPKIFTVTSAGKTLLTEGTIGILDNSRWSKVDLLINPSYWDVNGNTGVKAYLEEAYFTLEESELDLEYSHVPMLGGVVHVEQEEVAF